MFLLVENPLRGRKKNLLDDVGECGGQRHSGAYQITAPLPYIFAAFSLLSGALLCLLILVRARGATALNGFIAESSPSSAIRVYAAEHALNSLAIYVSAASLFFPPFACARSAPSRASGASASESRRASAEAVRGERR